MEKFTIIYSEPFQRGTHRCYFTKMARVETEDIAKTLGEEPYDGCLLFLLEGWPRRDSEGGTLVATKDVNL